MNVAELRDRVLSGAEISPEEALWLLQDAPEDELFAASAEITRRMADRRFDACSIINSKSGRCSEDCKWCAQSAHHHSGVTVYGFVGEEECLRHAKYNEAQGIRRFSLVNSGRTQSKAEIEKICAAVRVLKKETSLGICASLGLLDYESLCRLREAGVGRYHCNLETAPSFFPSLCSTHTQEQKIRTLEDAQRAGMEICSGGIIGMGESLGQRVEFAFALKRLGLSSIPINLLSPIKGTPLENAPRMSESEILRCIAMFRFVNPGAFLRFAGGRSALSGSGVKKALFIGINAAIVGDLLTTLGSKAADDFKMIRDAGYEL